METSVHNIPNTSQSTSVDSTKEDVTTKVQEALTSFKETVDQLEETTTRLEKGLKGVPKVIEEQKARVLNIQKRVSSIFT